MPQKNTEPTLLKCKECGTEFHPRTHNQIFCCKKCAWRNKRRRERAKEQAALFDASPDYRANALRFVTRAEQAGIYDDLGATAMESAGRAAAQTENAALCKLWKEVREDAE